MLKSRFARRAVLAAMGPSHVVAGHSPTPDLARRRRFLRDHVLIHTHVPKTAGATLAAGLAAIAGGVATLDLRLGPSVPLDRLSEADLAGLALVTGHFDYGLHARFPARHPLYFAAVREPADRAVSDYRFLAGNAAEPGHDAAAAENFETWESRRRERRANEQARMLLGARHGRPIDADEAIAHIDRAYLLVIPQPEVTRALDALRAAFGTAPARVADSNVSTGHDVVPDVATVQAIRAANAADTALYEHVRETFDDRLRAACAYIGERCLGAVPVPEGAAADGETGGETGNRRAAHG